MNALAQARSPLTIHAGPATGIAIVGAGPYGLSLAAHLSACGTPCRIFGSPMDVWRKHMPRGMCLKSDGFASDLYDPDRHFTLAKFCADRGIRYADYGMPVPVEVFAEYGLDFQRRLVPTLSEASIVRVERAANGFTLHTDDGETIAARRVVIATGISHFSFVPAPLSSLPSDVCSHSFALRDLTRFAGKRVLIVGGGASAADLAALLVAQGASAELISRKEIEFHRPPERMSLWRRILAPNLGLGPNFRSALYTAFPGLFRHLPARVRRRIVTRHLGPAAAWFVRDRVVAAVPMHAGFTLAAATPTRGGVRLRCEDSAGRSVEWQADHVIAATGYKVSIGRLAMLDPSLRESIRSDSGSPVLSSSFESSVRGLYFVGVAAAASFGPVMRFAIGANYTARHLGRHLATRGAFLEKG
jgi:thioredoxin reductase